MRKRRYALGALACLGLVVVAGILNWFLAELSGRRFYENYTRIQAGMTQADLELLLDGPAEESGGLISLGGPGHRWVYWDHQDYRIRVVFDEKDGAMYKQFSDSRVPKKQLPVLDRIRTWLGISSPTYRSEEFVRLHRDP
jgi:hypothetical protein